MTKIENILEKPYVNRGAYRVPEGYFDTLKKNIMDNVPEESKVSRWKIVSMTPKFRYAVAACMTGIIVATGTVVFNATDQKTTEAVAAMETSQHDVISEEYINDCMDYAMVDKDDMYMYLADQ